MGEILDELPLRYSAFSTCFRREAGAAGKDTRGMFRVHQFNKVELFVYCEPERVARRARPAARDRGGARRRRSACRTASSTSPPATSAPRPRRSTTSRPGSRHQQRYREITSTSNTTDFQARRLGIRYRAGEKRLETPHTLNGTAVTDRWLLAILENFRGEVPDVLQSFGAPARVAA